MHLQLAADLLVVIHLGFILFVLFGALLVWRWRAVIWLHVPACLWGAYIELSGEICPLTPLEQQLRQRAGESGYGGGFIDHYVIPVIYPQALERTDQLLLGLFVLALNLAAYGGLIRHWRRVGHER